MMCFVKYDNITLRILIRTVHFCVLELLPEDGGSSQSNLSGNKTSSNGASVSPDGLNGLYSVFNFHDYFVD